MRILKADGQEMCSSCGHHWKSVKSHPTLCDNCFCPETYRTFVDDVDWDPFQSSVAEDAMQELKQVIKEQLQTAIPSTVFQKLPLIQRKM